MLKRFTTWRISPKRIWQAALTLILMAGIYACLSGPETVIARQWIEAMLGRFR
jgi:hypothetical protein